MMDCLKEISCMRSREGELLLRVAILGRLHEAGLIKCLKQNEQSLNLVNICFEIVQDTNVTNLGAKINKDVHRYMWLEFVHS